MTLFPSPSVWPAGTFTIIRRPADTRISDLNVVTNVQQGLDTYFYSVEQTSSNGANVLSQRTGSLGWPRAVGPANYTQSPSNTLRPVYNFFRLFGRLPGTTGAPLAVLSNIPVELASVDPDGLRPGWFMLIDWGSFRFLPTVPLHVGNIDVESSAVASVTIGNRIAIDGGSP